MMVRKISVIVIGLVLIIMFGVFINMLNQNRIQDIGQLVYTAPTPSFESIQGFCGDGEIGSGETCENCTQDLGLCVLVATPDTCGDLVAQSWENCEECPQDTGTCQFLDTFLTPSAIPAPTASPPD